MAVVRAEGDEIFFAPPDVDEVRLFKDAADEVVDAPFFLVRFAGEGEVLPLLKPKLSIVWAMSSILSQ